MGGKTIQAVFSTALATFTIYFNAITVPLVVLIIFMVFDYLTGMYKAYKSKNISSKTGIEGIVKKLFYGVLIVVAMGVDYLIYCGLLAVHIQINYDMWFGMLVTIWLLINEMISILENLSCIGVPMPKFLIKVVQKLRVTVENESGEEK